LDLGVSDDAGYNGYVKSKNKILTSASVFWWPHGSSLKKTQKNAGYLNNTKEKNMKDADTSAF
jgi:hypothetical protein